MPRSSSGSFTMLASAARTATNNSQDFSGNWSSGLIVIDATAEVDTASVVFTVQGKDIASGKYFTVLESAAITAVGTTILRVHPALTASANTIAADILPSTFRVLATHADADSLTYSVGAIVA